MPDRHPVYARLRRLYGRQSECAALDELLVAVRSGRSGALVVRGEAGIGKSALLEYATTRASGFRVARATGVESEMELAFAGLQQLCSPMLDRLERLPDPQRDALATAFGLVGGPAPDRFLVGLAALTLVSEAADEQPLLCVVEDAHWLDVVSAQVLGFVARRLTAEAVAMLFTLRHPTEEFRRLPELVVEGLRDNDARELLDSVISGPLDARVRERILVEAHGSPLALLELPRGLRPAELAGGFFGLPTASSLSSPVEESFLRRVEALPPEARLLVLLAAAEPLGDPALLWRAASRFGLRNEASGYAKAAGLLEIAEQVRFRHPLVRSAVYHAASVADRHRVHAALAEATDPEVDRDRRAWHRAQATPAADDEVAAELERSADRAQHRGGMAAAAAFLERSASLTVAPERRARRALAAAEAKQLAGAPDAALGLLGTAQAGPLDELGRARVDLLRAQIAFDTSRGSDAPAVLLFRAAKRLEPLDVGLARRTYLDALSAAQFAGRLAGSIGVKEVAEAALAAPRSTQPPLASDLLLDGLAMRFTGGIAASAPILRRALTAYPKAILSEDELRWMWLAGHAAVDLWDDETWDSLATRHLELARETGALTVLPLVLSIRIAAHTLCGELAAAAALIDEVQAAVETTGSRLAPYGALMLAAWRRQEAEASELTEAIVHEVVPRGEGLGLTITDWASAVLYNGLGRYEDAMAAAERASEHPEDLGFSNWGLVELILAAVRCGERERATKAFERLLEMTRASGSDWALGIEARSRALLSEGDDAERLYLEAIERLARTRVRVELARAHLQYGEWLRRARRRFDAREHLRTAQDMFAAMGIEAFKPRTEREILATGETARKRTVETRDELTPQEAQIARLARDGLTNPEIGTRLYISPRTVEYHLHKVFSKLGISSRNELAVALPGERDPALAG
jgi:DNA-binding CsgD family transcriptional regulator/tetratricopeptide (TPR) repeat protein